MGEKGKDGEIRRSVPFVVLTLLLNPRRELDANEIINNVRNLH